MCWFLVWFGFLGWFPWKETGMQPSPVQTLLTSTRIWGRYNNYFTLFYRNSSYGYGVQLLNDHQRVTSGGSCISADQSQRPLTSLVPTTHSRSLHDTWLLASCIIMLGVQVCWWLRYTSSASTSHHIIVYSGVCLTCTASILVLIC